ncbi:MAG: hypothetical protein OXG84_14055 [Chloroflexi bacterium]|nr:hypothetical protein [Chloroflexota bacterium]
MKRADLLLKIIAAAEGKPLTPAQLQKVAFLLRMERGSYMPDDYYRFRKYDYGPFCAEVYRDAERLECEGKISISIHPRGGWKQYSATVAGIQTEMQNIPDEVSTYIEEKVRWARQLSFQELVRAVYQMYPSFRENSVFQG